MKFSLLYELDMPASLDKSEHEIFHEAVEQTILAEELGYHCVWAVEHHFLKEFSHSSAPETFLATVAAKTERIRIGHGVVLVPPPFNHPARVAERVSMLDLASDGRVEFGTGRSITKAELGGFNIDPDDTRGMWLEATREIPKMMTEDLYPGFEGEYFSMPERHVVPKPLQKPHPPMWMACTSPPSFEMAGKYGLGVLCFTIGEPGQLEERITAYREAIKNPEPISQVVNEQVAGFSVLHCGEDDAAAVQRGGEAAVWYFGKLFEYFGEIAAYDAYKDYRKQAEDASMFYEEKVRDKLVKNLVDNKVIVAGDPEHCIDTLKDYEAQGIDHFIGIQQVGAIEHEEIMESIRLFGEKVIPAFR